MSSASTPPTAKKKSVVSRYRMPMRLWSTVATQANRPLLALGSGRVLEHCGRWRRCSSQALEEADEVIHLGVGQVQVGHLAARLDGLRVLQPARQVGRRVLQDAGAQRAAARQMGQIGGDVRIAVTPGWRGS